jgi:hypothetical protein
MNSKQRAFLLESLSVMAQVELDEGVEGFMTRMLKKVRDEDYEPHERDHWIMRKRWIEGMDAYRRAVKVTIENIDKVKKWRILDVDERRRIEAAGGYAPGADT